MSLVCANAVKGDYAVIGVDLPTKRGKKLINDLNNGIFPLVAEDKKIGQFYNKTIEKGNFLATYYGSYVPDSAKQTTEDMADWWMGVWERIRLSLIARARDPESALGDELREGLREVGRALQDDPRLQAQINRFARCTAVGMTSRYGAQIVALVSETVKRWDAGTVTDRIESAVGRDLQFIRINGTLVGGLVGVTIHTLVVLF